MIYLGLDYGERRIGVACSDGLGRFAEPIGRIQYRSAPEIWEKLVGHVRETRAETIVVGLPKRTTGESKSEVEKVMKFVGELTDRIPRGVSVVTWDERFTTKEADRILREGNVGFKKRKEKRDALAAAIMLQNYLDYKRIGSSHVQD